MKKESLKTAINAMEALKVFFDSSVELEIQGIDMNYKANLQAAIADIEEYLLNS